MSCQFCGKTFNRGFNLRRHEQEYCPLKDQVMSETESQRSDDEVSTQDSTRTTESETEENDPWTPMVDEAMDRYREAFEEMKTNLLHDGVDEQSADEQAYSMILPRLQEELQKIYMQRLLWIEQLKENDIHQKIMETKDSFEENDDFDPEEAIEAAVDKRKFLFKRILKNCNFPEDNNSDQ